MGKGDLHSLDQVVIFDKGTCLDKLKIMNCPPLALKHLLMLTSLRTLIVKESVGLVGPLGGGQSDVEWQLPVEYIKIYKLNGNTGEELTELLPHLPKLSKLVIWWCKSIKKLVVGVDVQQTTSEVSEMRRGEITATTEEEDVMECCSSLFISMTHYRNWSSLTAKSWSWWTRQLLFLVEDGSKPCDPSRD